MSTNYKSKCNFSGNPPFNPFTNGREEFFQAERDNVWINLLNSLNAIDMGMVNNAAAGNSIFEVILEHIDFPTTGNFSSLIIALTKNQSAAIMNSKDKDLYWNDSMQELFDHLFSITNPLLYDLAATQSLNSSNAPFRVWDILTANAGYKFDDAPWVIPWRNRQHKSYLGTRLSDKNLLVLNDDSNLQFTNDNSFEKAEAEQDLRLSYVSLGENNISFSSNEGMKFNKVTFDEETGFITYSYSEELGDRELVGVSVLKDVITYLNESQLINLVDQNKRWIRLLMPKYLRNVEVEDLNRNFWVIGQVIDLILYYLYDPNGGLGKSFKIMGNELKEMWNNVEYLWSAIVANEGDSYPTMRTWHIEQININPFNPLYATLYSSKHNFIGDRAAIQKILEYFKYEYPNQNLALIPCIESSFYEQNFHSSIYLPGLLLLERFKVEDGTIKSIKEPKYKWYLNINEETITFDDISKGSFGTGFYDNGINFYYCSNNAAKCDSIFYGAFRPKIQLKYQGETYISNSEDLPTNLTMEIEFEDAIMYAMENKRRYKTNGVITGTDIGPEPQAKISIPKHGLYMGELISKKFKPQIFIAARELVVPSIDEGHIDNDRDNHIKTVKKVSTLMYNYVARHDVSNENAVYGLKQAHPTDSTWIFRIACVRYFNPLPVVNESYVVSDEPTSISEIEGDTWTNTYTIQNNKLYKTPMNGTYGEFGPRVGAAIYNPLNGVTTYKCNFMKQTEITSGIYEVKNFIVLTNGNKITKDNWAVIFIYGLVNTFNNNKPQENNLLIFYSDGNSELVQFRYNNGWEVKKYYRNLDEIDFTSNILANNNSSYWYKYFGGNVDNIYHNKTTSPDTPNYIALKNFNDETYNGQPINDLGDKFKDSFNTIADGLYNELMKNTKLLGGGN